MLGTLTLWVGYRIVSGEGASTGHAQQMVVSVSLCSFLGVLLLTRALPFAVCIRALIVLKLPCIPEGAVRVPVWNWAPKTSWILLGSI